MLAEVAIKAAYSTNNIELYLLALSILSQPVLTISASLHKSKTDLEMNKRSADITNALLSLSYRSQNASIIIDLDTMAKEYINSTLHTISNLTINTSDVLKKILCEDELMVTLAHDPDDTVYRALFTKNSISGLEKLDQSIWSSTAFDEWENKYPRAYGIWEPINDIFSEENPSIDEVKNTVRSLSFGVVEKGYQIIISSDSSLAKFPFGLSLVNNEHYSLNAKIASIPSPGWLVETRSHIWSGKNQTVAWLGSPRTDDFALQFLRDRLTPVFTSNKISLIDQDTPDNIEGTCLAFVASHGSTGFGDQFRTVSDKVKSYSSIEFAGFFLDVVVWFCLLVTQVEMI